MTLAKSHLNLTPITRRHFINLDVAYRTLGLQDEANEIHLRLESIKD